MKEFKPKYNIGDKLYFVDTEWKDISSDEGDVEIPKIYYIEILDILISQKQSIKTKQITFSTHNYYVRDVSPSLINKENFVESWKPYLENSSYLTYEEALKKCKSDLYEQLERHKAEADFHEKAALYIINEIIKILESK